MTMKHLSTFEREMQDPLFREQFEKEYLGDHEKWQNDREKARRKNRPISDCNSKNSLQ